MIAARPPGPASVFVLCGAIVASAAGIAGARQVHTSRILVAGFVLEHSSVPEGAEDIVRRLTAELRRQGRFATIDEGPAYGRPAGLDDAAYWRGLGEEYAASHIVSGMVAFRRAPPRVSQRTGRGGIYALQPGFFLEIEAVLIDGATGRPLASQRLPRQVRYGEGRHASRQRMYLGMVEDVMPELARAVFDLLE